MPDERLDEFYNGPIFPAAGKLPSRVAEGGRLTAYASREPAPQAMKLLLDTCTFLWIVGRGRLICFRPA